MTYSESARGVMIGELRVIRELEIHGVTSPADIAECFAAIPAAPLSDGVARWDAGAVLAWLGY